MYQGLKLKDPDLAVLATRLRNPKLGVRLVPLRNGIFRRSRRSFTAAEVTSWIAGYKRCDRASAAKIAQRLVNANVIRLADGDMSITGTKEVFEDCQKDLYTFMDHMDNSAALAMVARGLASAKKGGADSTAALRPRIHAPPVDDANGLTSAEAGAAAAALGPGTSMGLTESGDSSNGGKAGGRRGRAESASKGTSNVSSLFIPSSANGVVLNDVPWEEARVKPRSPVALTAALLDQLRSVCVMYSHESPAVKSMNGTNSSDGGSSGAIPQDSNRGSALVKPSWDELSADSVEATRISESLARHGQALATLGVAELEVDSMIPQFAPQISVAHFVSSAEFARFERATAELQAVDLSTLTTRSAKAAFALNLYNLLLLHARLSFGTRVNRVDRARVNSRVVYRAGGHIFCLDDILNVMLRGESRGKGFGKLMNRSGKSADADCHRRLAVHPAMPEALLAISVTASSYDPPIRAYYEDTLGDDLAEVGDKFLSTWVRPRLLSSKGSVARVPKVFSMFGSDFVLSERLPTSGKDSDVVVTQSVLVWIADHIKLNQKLSERVRKCQSLEFYKTGDALEARDGKGDTIAPFFWSA